MSERQKELVVVKYGSSSVTNQDGMDMQRLNEHANRLARLKGKCDIILVSSGSVVTGRAIWRKQQHSRISESDQPYAMLGSARVVTAWQEAFANYGISAGQLLLTHKEIDTESKELQTALEQNLRHDIITVANENDPISQIELAKLAYGGDNDGLAAHITRLVGARALFLLTDQKGVLNRSNNLISTVPATEREWERVNMFVDDGNSERPSGMRSKTRAAIEVARVGIDAYIASADVPFEAIVSPSRREGTHFVALNPAA